MPSGPYQVTSVLFIVYFLGLVGGSSVADEYRLRPDIPGYAPVLIAQGKKPIKPQLQITDGDVETFPKDAPRLAPVSRTPAPQEKSEAAKTWDIISGTQDPEVLNRFIAKFPGTIQAALAAQKNSNLARSIPAIEPEPAEPIGVSEPDPAPEDLALDIQNELQRLGCSPGKADGKWGTRTTRSAKRFTRQTGIDAVTTIPNTDLLAKLRARSEPACRLQCGRGKSVVNGQCVARSCPSGQRLSSKGNCYKPRTAKTCTSGQKLSSKGRCYTPKVKKAKTVKTCRRGERLSSRGVCFVPKPRVVKTSKPIVKKKQICTPCERSSGQIIRVCGREKINRDRARGECE